VCVSFPLVKNNACCMVNYNFSVLKSLLFFVVVPSISSIFLKVAIQFLSIVSMLSSSFCHFLMCCHRIICCINNKLEKIRRQLVCHNANYVVITYPRDKKQNRFFFF
jgi:hypothetical protein